MSKKGKLEIEMLNYNEFVVVDIETTAFSIQKGGRIIEIGAVKIKNGEIVDNFSTLVNPGLKIPKKITELTKITNDMVKDAPYVGNVLQKFNEFISDSVIVAHNVSFDWDRFLKPALETIGIKSNHKVMDTVSLSKFTFPDKKKHTLIDLCSYLDVPLEKNHRAIDDAIATAKCFLKLKVLNAEKLNDNLQVKFFNEISYDEGIEICKSIVIKRVKYWEKNKMKRLYVNFSSGINRGEAYFNIITKTWYIKKFDLQIDINLINKEVLKFLNLETVDDLCKYRNNLK
ncbi:3'-5' exoribonuclease [Clostridioides sp. ZZV14-6045]|uniref:3'-5' exonuclease n=1 Tax=Clostridioides sp. ZZV14-6045 TaxID=2811489 RepID=UPI001D12AE13|nr:3'-5' exoribonuclease [Clostridioides sp. ZZV14-6045]